MSVDGRGVAVGQRHPARQDHGPRRLADRALRRRVRAPGRPRGPLRTWPGAGACPSSAIIIAIMPGARLLGRRPALRRRPGHLHRHTGRRSPRSSGACFRPIGQPAVDRRATSRPRWPCSTGSSSTSTCPSTSSKPTSRSAAPDELRGEVALRRRRLPLRRRRRPDARRHRPRPSPAGTQPRRRRRDRLGQDDARLSGRRGCTSSSGGRVTLDGVDVRDLPASTSLARDGRRRLPGDLPLPRHASRENLRFARPDATDEELEAAARAAQIHDMIAAPAGRLRHRRRRARLPLLRRREAAHRHRPDASCATRRCSSSTRRPALWTPRPSAPCRRRSTAVRGPHDHHHRPPALDRPRRRPDRRARRRADRRARHARRALERGGRVRRRSSRRDATVLASEDTDR